MKKKTETDQEFVEKYRSLCDEYGMRFKPVLEFVETNHGTYEIAARLRIQKITS